MRDYAGFGYASLLFGYVSLGLVMFRLSLLFRLCFCLSLLFRYVIIHGYVLCIISMILYYIKDITYL